MTKLREKPCQWADERLEPYLEGELSPADARALEGHLGSCARCRQEEASAREIAAELRGLPALDTPRRVLRGVEEKAQGRGLFRWKGPLFWVPVSSGVAATLLIVVAAFLLRPAPKEPVPDQAEVAAAVAEARFALAFVGQVSRRTGSTLREEQLKPWVLAPLAAVVVSPGQGAGEKPSLEEI
jgi:anti-sigma factor RsiW